MKLAKLKREQLAVPCGALRRSVIGQRIGAPLLFGQASDLDSRHLGHPDAFGGQDPGVAGDDLTLALLHARKIQLDSACFDPDLFGVKGLFVNLGEVQKGLGWNASDVEAGASELGVLLVAYGRCPRKGTSPRAGRTPK